MNYVSWNPDITWAKEYVGPWSARPRMVFDSKWRPHLIWFWSYAYRGSSGWHSLTIDEEDVLDAGYVEIDAPDTIVVHAHRDSLGWHLLDDTVDTDEFYIRVGVRVSIAVDDSCIHLVYGKYAGWGIKSLLGKYLSSLYFRSVV